MGIGRPALRHGGPKEPSPNLRVWSSRLDHRTRPTEEKANSSSRPGACAARPNVTLTTRSGRPSPSRSSVAKMEGTCPIRESSRPNTSRPKSCDHRARRSRSRATSAVPSSETAATGSAAGRAFDSPACRVSPERASTGTAARAAARRRHQGTRAGRAGLAASSPPPSGPTRPFPSPLGAPPERSSHRSISSVKAKTLPRFPPGTRRTGSPRSCSHRIAVRTSRPTCSAISFQESRRRGTMAFRRGEM